MTRVGIIFGGGVGFVVLALACIAHQSHRLSAVQAPDSNRPLLVDHAAPVPAPVFHAEFDGATVVLSGRLGDSARRDAIVERARRLYGAEHVTDRLTIAPVTPAPWLDAEFPPDLRGARRASALMQDSRLLVIGETGTDAARTRLEATLQAWVPQGIRIDLRLNSDDVQAVEPDAIAPSRGGGSSRPRALAAP